MTEDRPSRARVAIVAVGVVAIVAAVQLGAIAIYRSVEGRRSGADEPGFFVEALDRAAPELALTTRNGRVTRLVDYGGRPPCVEKLPGLIESARAFDLTLLAVSVDDDWEVIEGFFDGAIPPEGWRPVEPEGHRRYDVIGLPDTFLIDEEGRIRGRYGGARDWTTAATKAHFTSSRLNKFVGAA